MRGVISPNYMYIVLFAKFSAITTATATADATTTIINTQFTLCFNILYTCRNYLNIFNVVIKY